MGPKGKPKTPKGKQPPPAKPETDPAEVVTELQKEFFEFQLADIEKKLSRITAREEELTAGTAELEEKIEEFRKEKGAVVAEYEQLLAAKEEEKCAKREETIFLSEDIKNRIEQHKQHIQDFEQKYSEMVEELATQIEQLEEEVRIMEDFKQNREAYTGDLDKLEQQMNEAEMQHQRNLFEINSKCEKAKGKVQKELQARLLQLSIEFRQKNQKKIGNPCHRLTLENKAIQSVLVQMKDEILEYEERHAASEMNVRLFRERKNQQREDSDKMIARTIVQVHIIKTLMRNTEELLETLGGFAEVDAENRALLKKLLQASAEVDRKTTAIEDAKEDIKYKLEETNIMKEAARHLKRSSRRLTALVRNSLKVAEEASAIRLIPLGGMEEERYLTMEAKINLFRKRRDVVFARKGRLLQHLLEFLSRAQLTEEDKRLLTTSSDTVDLGSINFGQIYGKPHDQGDSRTSVPRETVEEKQGPVYYTSLTSLPRSESGLGEKRGAESGSEGREGEFGECGEGWEGEVDEAGEVRRGGTPDAPAEDGEEGEIEDENSEDSFD